MAHQSKRHTGNSNLHLYYEDTFRGLPVMTSHIPFITEYLEGVHETTQLALNAHRRVFAVRFDLRFPHGDHPLESDNTVISRFVDSLTHRIQSARERSRLRNGTAYQEEVRWCWVREVGQEVRPHYHCVLLLNRDTFHTVGCFQSTRANLYSRIQSSWASALRISLRHLGTCRDRQFLFDFDPGIPTIAKVIEVAKRLFPVQRFDQGLAGLRVHGWAPPVGGGYAVILTGNFKLMHIPSLPAHYDLNH
ncbi:transposase [Pseudomonas fluorescens HK44]|uniref:Transposase n=1 Tax=Pseudomonas fluorescens HK44 TaxID=1042209 RepID=A0A010S5W8_PSEFL|nr:transposase [Pseudomonas fluorescens HK44]